MGRANGDACMNDHVTISTFQMFELFPTQEHARVYLESRHRPLFSLECAHVARSGREAYQGGA